MKYVLVHGAWHGGWCWREVARRLRSQGHDVYTPTLTGLGERAHLLARSNDLSLHIKDVLNVIKCEELEEVVLVGHSYAGMIITALADRLPSVVGSLIYVDAYIPQDGQSMLDLRPAQANEVLMERVRKLGDGWRMPPLTAEELGIELAEDRAWVNRRATPMALACYTEKIALSGSAGAHLPRIYIRTSYANASFERWYEEAERDENWKAYRLDGGHNPMIDRPESLVALLV
jgi:pimeloyl-ACP methyl ester carboxylesterase